MVTVKQPSLTYQNCMILAVLPVTTATVERSFSTIELIKTRLRIRMGEDTLEGTKRICIEGSDYLNGNTLEDIVNHYKAVKLSL